VGKKWPCSIPPTQYGGIANIIVQLIGQTPRVIVHTYNPHIGSFLPSLGLRQTKVYSVVERADIVMKSDESTAFVSNSLPAEWSTFVGEQPG
jgi:hypothetical protein